MAQIRADRRHHAVGQPLVTPRLANNPLSRTCPKCDAQPGHACRRWIGGRVSGKDIGGGYWKPMKKTHDERKRRLNGEVAPLRSPTPTHSPTITKDTRMTEPTRAHMDCETTSLHDGRRAWDVAAIICRDGQPDVEFQWFIDILDLDLAHADPVALDIGRFWDRHPQARWVRKTGDRVQLAPDCPTPLPIPDGVVREQTMLSAVAGLTADRAIICGSNPAFEQYTLARRMAWHDITPCWHYHPEDVPGVARGWLLAKGLPAPRKSDEIARACGINPDDYERHTALGDCRLFRDLEDRVEGRWVPGPPRRCATSGAGWHRPPTVMVDGEPRCDLCARTIDPTEGRWQPLPDRVAIR